MIVTDLDMPPLSGARGANRCELGLEKECIGEHEPDRLRLLQPNSMQLLVLRADLLFLVLCLVDSRLFL